MSSSRRLYPASYAVQTLDRPVNANVWLPGSKSITNRALIVAAQAEGDTELSNPLDSDDTAVMRECLTSLGVGIDDSGDSWVIQGSNRVFEPVNNLLDAKASGTTARFITGVGALANRPVTIDGTPRMRERPIGDLADALTQLGVDTHSNGGYPPVTVARGGELGGSALVDASKSSQFVSAILLASPSFDRTVRLVIRDNIVVSRPYIQSTIEVMRAFGASIGEEEGAYIVEPSGYGGVAFPVEPDASAAVYPAVAAAVTGGRSIIHGLSKASTQADMKAFTVLEMMGCTVIDSGDDLEVAGPERLNPVDIDLNTSPDAALGLAVACLFAHGPSRLRNLQTLRWKETDRIEALARELSRLGASVEIDNDDLIVFPKALRGTTIETYEDHRVAMAFSIVGLAIPNVVIQNPGCVSKTWPGYFDSLEDW